MNRLLADVSFSGGFFGILLVVLVILAIVYLIRRI